jgi:hypothetical protein
MPMRTIFLFTSFLFNYFSLLSQPSKVAADRFIIRTNSSVFWSRKESDIEGTPYLKDHFANGDVIGKKEHFKGIQLRYNVYEDNFEFLNGETIYMLKPDAWLDRVILEKSTYVLGVFEYMGKVRTGFLEVIDTGSLATLYSKKSVIFKEREEPSAMQYEIKPARFIRNDDTFYFQSRGDEIVQIPNLKKLLKMLPFHNKEVSDFVKTERIATNREDLIKLFKYYNALDGE